MIPDFSSFIENTSGAKCCLVYSQHFHIAASSGRVCRLLNLKNVFHVALVKIIKVLYISMHRYLMRLISIETKPLAFNSVK